MPKYRKSTERRKANRVAKDYIAAGLSAAEVARRRGTAPQNESMKVNRKPVQDALQAFLDSPELDDKLIEVAEEGLDAISQTKLGRIPDHVARYRFWNGLMQAKGKIKQDGREAGIKILNIVYAYRKEPGKVADAS